MQSVGLLGASLVRDVRIAESIGEMLLWPPWIAGEEAAMQRREPEKRNGQTPHMRRHGCLAIFINLKWPDMG